MPLTHEQVVQVYDAELTHNEEKINIDRFYNGPWTKDMDANPYTEYSFKVFGRNCYIKRMPQGHWCGYVSIINVVFPLNENGEPLEYDMFLDVHGGITGGGKYDHDDIIGFDTTHRGDMYPKRKDIDIEAGLEKTTYRDFDWVKIETGWLAFQLSKLVPAAGEAADTVV